MKIRAYKSDMSGFSYRASDGTPMGDGSETWEELDTPFEFKVKRSTGGQPGAIEIVFPGVNHPKDAPPLWMFQRIQVMDEDPPIPSYPGSAIGRMFIGRVDSVAPRQDPRYGRVWVVKARDYLASLVDNYVDAGKQRAFEGGLDIPVDAGTTGPPWVPKWVEKSQIDDQGSPVPDSCNDGEHCGMRRHIIISELALNMVPLPFGLAGVNPFSVPNSLPVEYNFENVRNLRILDAITEVVREDPWGVGADYVDSKTADAIGGEFQLKYVDETGTWEGQRAQYFRRGGISWEEATLFKYGGSGPGVIPIIGYDFPQEGHDLYSRAKVIGKGQAQDVGPDDEVNPGGWGTGFVSNNPQIEGIWLPPAGQFAIMRGKEVQESAIVGDWFIAVDETGEDGSNPLALRGMRDRAASKMISFSGDLSRGRNRGLRGMIRVPGYPRRAVDLASLIVGTAIEVLIPQALGSEAVTFIVESWTFTYPENITTIQLANKATSSLPQVMGGWAQDLGQSGASHADQQDSGWKQTSGLGFEKVVHAMGVAPRTIILEVARQDGDKVDRRGNPVPVRTTITEVPRLANEPAQGQNFGYTVRRSDDLEFEFGLAYWVADSSGEGGWLKDGEAIFRVRMRP